MPVLPFSWQFLSGLFIGTSLRKHARNLYGLYWVTPYRITLRELSTSGIVLAAFVYF